MGERADAPSPPDRGRAPRGPGASASRSAKPARPPSRKHCTHPCPVWRLIPVGLEPATSWRSPPASPQWVSRAPPAIRCPSEASWRCQPSCRIDLSAISSDHTRRFHHPAAPTSLLTLRYASDCASGVIRRPTVAPSFRLYLVCVLLCPTNPALSLLVFRQDATMLHPALSRSDLLSLRAGCSWTWPDAILRH